ncbi:MucBP domain-containing protein [Streptococcus sp. IsoGale021]|uniref:MucBP domain-containing protein n=1 Tax=Streptococcus TaxID=1301 RepID=UPI002000AF20|nr:MULTISPECIES: MucBP domain-containing protein [Streptococcus]MCY7210080.1 MucBP domain-containing protein [Streptococcus anginosus]MCY7212617.1 MucBP domain-containing protein [Streptococcus anginosus]MDQ8695423.1 MucBP domain-containing protein [Streptococcus sp. IsoGale021]MDU5129384.1 MucBP domain-containing protein [Streptococcus anginosus]
MKKSRFFLASTAVLLSALGANPVLARDVERSISTTIVTPTVDSNKKASTETPESKQENANTSTAVMSAAPVTPDKSTSVVSDTDKPSASDKVEAPKTTRTTPTAPEKDKSELLDSSSKVEPPKIDPVLPATPDKDKSGTSDSESSKPKQSEPEKKYGDVTVEYKSKDGALIAPKELDTPTSVVGTDYDTTDYRRETIISSEGKKYRLDLKATQGYEKGKVLEGNTNITYYYDLVTETPDSNKVVPPKPEPDTPDKTKPSTSDSSDKGATPQDKPPIPNPSEDSSVSPDSSIADTVTPMDTIPSDGMLDTQLEQTNSLEEGINPSILTEKSKDEPTTSDVDLKKDETFSLDNASSVTTKKGDTIDNPIKSIISPADPLLTDKGFEIIGNDQGEVTIKNADGSKTSVPAAQVGARANPDGTVTVKSSNGKFTLLPDTGEATTILATIGLFILALLGFKKVKPFEKDNWLIG